MADYRPKNVHLNGSQLSGYGIVQVLPYQPLK